MTPYHANTFFTLTSKELFEKVKEDFKSLENDISPYSIFNYFVSAYHLKDYIKNEFSLNETQDIRAFEDMNELLNIAGFIANKGKHFDVNGSKYKNMQTRYYSGKADGTMLGDGTWRANEGETYKILKADGEVIEVKVVAKRLLDGRQAFINSKELF